MKLRDYQEEALGFLCSHGRAVYADPPGTGKTPTTASWMQQAGSHRTVIVAPRDVRKQWVRELSLWYPEVEATVYEGSPDKRTKLRGEFARDAHPKALVMMHETLRQDIEEFLKGVDTFVADEGHRFVGRTTLIAKAAAKLARRADQVAYLTGTPMVNAPEEFWVYLNHLDPKTYTSFHRWAETHCKVKVTDFGGKAPRAVTLYQGLRSEHVETVQKQLADWMIQRTEEELGLDWMIEPQHVPVEVELSAKERKHYDELKRKKFTELPGGLIQVTNAVALSTRLRQITSEWSGLDPELGVGSKVRAAAEKIEDLGRPVVVFVAYKASATQLSAELVKRRIPHAMHTGLQNDEERERAKRRFIDGEATVLIGSYKTMREGVDGLQHDCNHIVTLDREWTPAANGQAIGRLRRDGQTKQVVVWDIFAADTIDAVVERANLDKIAVAEAIRGRSMKEVFSGQ